MAVLEEVQAPAREVQAAGRDWSRIASWAAFAAYVVLTAILISRHEPWFDEAQAWLIARDSNPFNLFPRVRYEGQPGLWHLMLMLPAKLLPYQVINWISGALGAAGAYVFLRRSPFPTPVKVMVPFTYFLFFQYGVIARNYALLPVVLFCVASTYPQRHERPARFAALLFVLAVTSTHGFLIAAALLAVHAVELFRQARAHSRRPERQAILSILVLGLALGVVALGLIPPGDRTFATDGVRAVDPETFLSITGGMLNQSMAENRLVLVLVLAASLWFLRRRRVLHLYALPTALLLGFFAFVHNAPWHEGVLFLVWVFALWVGMQRRVPGDRRDDWSRKAALGALAVVCLFQINWAIRTAVLDFREPFSGSRAMAAYIRDHNLDESTIFGYHWASFAVMPYFDRNIFANYNPPGKPTYWLWSERNHMVQDFELIEGLQPDYLIFPIKLAGTEAEAMEALTSYRQKEVFWGEMYWKGRILQPEVYILFERKA